MMRMKKLLSLVAAAALTFSMAACGSTNNGSDTIDQSGDTIQTPSAQAVEGAIDVVSREAGSGTRSAFEEIIGFNGEDQDPLTANATIKDGNGVVATYVAANDAAIGYVSLESLNDSVVACKVDGVETTEENIENGTYTVQRPFIQIYKKGTDSALINAWFEFIESSEGQQIIKDVGLIGTANKNG